MHSRLRGPARTVSVRAMLLRRLLPSSFALALLTAASACKKAPEAGTDGPGGGGGAAGATQSGTVLRYKAGPAKLKQTVKASFSASGDGGGGEAKVDLTGLLDVSPSGADKLKIAYTVLEVRQVDLTGSMKPEVKEGQPAPDVKADVQAAKGARIVDLRGDEDKAATKGLAENAKSEKDKGGGAGGMVGAFLGLPPEMPKDGLAEGTPVKEHKEETTTIFGGIEIDMEIDTTYTLVKVDSSSGKRLAEVKIESEASGAKELAQGGQSMMLALDVTSEAVVVFNLDDQLPVSVKQQSTQAISAGPQGSFEIRFNSESSYEPAA